MLHLIINGKSGKGKGQKNLKLISDYCFKNNVAYTIHITTQPRQATVIAADVSTQDPDAIIVAVGGDGTFHEVLNGIADPKRTSVGFIPSGRGNDYAKSAKLSLNPVTALKNILYGETAYSDYIEVDGIRCLNVAGTGLDVDVLERVEGKKDTKITYLLSLIYCLKHFKPFKMTVTHEGVATQLECVMIGVCNGTCIGGGIKLSPLSKIDDGKLNLMAVSMPKNNKIMSVLPKFMKGKHIDMEITTHYLCEEIQVDSEMGYPIQLDGEIYRDKKLHCKIVAGGLKTFKNIYK